jgi:hypothetical protein
MGYNFERSERSSLNYFLSTNRYRKSFISNVKEELCSQMNRPSQNT